VRCGRGSRSFKGRRGKAGWVQWDGERVCGEVWCGVVWCARGVRTRMQPPARTLWRGSRRLKRRAWCRSGRGVARGEDRGEKREVRLVENRRRCRRRKKGRHVNGRGKAMRGIHASRQPHEFHKHASRDRRLGPGGGFGGPGGGRARGRWRGATRVTRRRTSSNDPSRSGPWRECQRVRLFSVVQAGLPYPTWWLRAVTTGSC
jgi:hypothetical protein